MPGPLESSLRNELARAVTAARRAAESGARAALQTLAVDAAAAHSGMSDTDKALRRRLRARGRQLGDRRDAGSGTQAIDRLVHEIAYEHWHRLLFARFLAENDLLIHPEIGQPITLDEVEELARDARVDRHALAASYAQQSLPQIFRQGDPVLEVELAVEHRNAIQKLLADLPEAVFTADDSLGWTYQYWQADKKDAVNESGNKIGADEISAVTQLFTEHYMVLFLYHNTIGAWRAGKILAANPSLARTATSEQELRHAVRLVACGGYDFEYLRFVRTEVEGDEEGKPTGPWRPAAGTFADWPQDARDLTILDPCCGSGHFLTAGFELMVRLRMDEESLSLEDAIRGVIAENLHGLELDPRCTQIAAFNLAMAAWRLARDPVALPAMHIACSGLALGSTREEWKKIAGSDSRLQVGMERLYDLFRQAPTLGSLLDPRTIGGDLVGADFDELAPLLDAALQRETDATDAPDHTERVVAARGMAAAAQLLSRRYALCITNVPYLGRGLQDEVLADYGEANHPEAKNDLATMFVERMLRWVEPLGSIAAVTPQNWLFLTGYKKLREKLLTRRRWDFVARLGVGAFETISGHVVNVVLPVISAKKATDKQIMGGIDVCDAKTATDKAKLLRGELAEGLDRDPDDFAVKVVAQKGQLGNPDARIAMTLLTSGSPLAEKANSLVGIQSGDSPRFFANYWETLCLGHIWVFLQGTTRISGGFSGLEQIIRWEMGRGSLIETVSARLGNGGIGAWIRGQEAWGQDGICVSLMGPVPVSVYCRGAFDLNCAVIVPDSENDLTALWAFCNSPEFEREVRAIDQSLKLTNRTLTKVPFDLDRWTKVAAEKFPNGLPEPQSNDPTQWLFHGHPAGMLEAGDTRSANPADLLQVAVGRLLGYRWPPELDAEMRLDTRSREWVSACDALLPFTDADGIVCLQPVKGEQSAASRVRSLLAASLGSDWSAAREKEFLAAIAAANSTDKRTAKPARNLEDWLRDDFFSEHCKLFHHRPFVWHLWDGQKLGFHCLVNAHKLTGPHGEGRKTLEAITYAYLGDWIDKQKSEVALGQEGADALLAAAQHLQTELKKILDGEPPYDLFVRWKPLQEQAIGWEPDINDGVRVNIRPFMTAEPMSGGKKGAGILRTAPNIKWDKDRGKEPESIRPRAEFPWFYGCLGDSKLDSDRLDWTHFNAAGKPFDGDRWNDLHYSNSVKKQARAEAAERAVAPGDRS
jgi:hypothetical protein